MSSRPSRSNLHRSTPKPEYGDWRVEVHNAEEVEHQRPRLGFRNMIHRTRVVARVLQETEPAAVWRNPVGDDPGVVPIHGWKRALRLAFALFVLLPLSLVMVFALLRQMYHAAPVMGQVDFWLSVPVWYASMGAMVFVALILAGLMQVGLIYVYVLGHELTHALAVTLCFGKVSTMRINVNGGYVETETDNFFVALAPYFIPLWMFCWVAVLSFINWLWPFEEYHAWLAAGFGFWWLFHIYWTIWVIPREQPDMLENGLLFSLLLVITANIVTLLGILMCFNVITLPGYWADFLDSAVQIYAGVCDLATWLLSCLG